ncbi:MAG: helix-turn-helix transcriptional regulator [Planctomycetaceae bacterium]
MITHSEPLLISAEQLAEMLQVSTRTLWRLLTHDELVRPVRIGGSTRWRLDEVRQWIEGGCLPQNSQRELVRR